MSLRGRLLAASLALVVVGLSVAGIATYFALRSFLFNRVDHQLDAADRSTESALRQQGGLQRELLSQVGVAAPGYYVQLRDAQGNFLGEYPLRRRGDPAPVAIPRDLPVPTTVGTPGSHDTAVFRTVPAASDAGRYRLRASGVPLADGSQGSLIVALPLSDVRATLGQLVGVEVLVGAAVLIAAAAFGAWLVRVGLRPIREIEATAAHIAEGDLTERVAIADDRTEVGRLGQALNVMLARIEAAFEERRASEAALRHSEERLRRFVSDASHELRTPVAAVRAYAELFHRGGDRHPEDLPRLMSRIEAEAARMGVLVEDLLLLTRLDQGRPLDRAPVDLGALAASAVEAARTIDPARALTLTVEGSVEVLGDKDRLRQVLDNLLANVRTHTPAGSDASVTVRLAGDRALIEVADSGPGVDPADAEAIFERFYRADPSRARDRGGSGLGLSIVSAITVAHGGRASVTNGPGPDAHGGAVFTVELPALVEAPQAPAPESEAEPDPEPQPEPQPASSIVAER